MNLCQGFKNNGESCNYKAVIGCFCKIHHNKKALPEGGSCITITFGDVCENNVGMQKIGHDGGVGFSTDDLLLAEDFFTRKGCQTEAYRLNDQVEEWSCDHPEIPQEEAYLLVIRGGVNALLAGINSSADLLLDEQLNLKWDTKAKMRGRVVNKVARHNLCYAEERQDPDYAQGKGTVIPFSTVANLKYIREQLPEIVGSKGENLMAEGNLYYDTSKCYIGFHGDAERNLVIALRLGEAMNLYYQWYYQHQPVGDLFTLELNHGDIYIMSAKSVGKDWKKSSLLTLRHAAARANYDKIFK